MGGWTFMLGGLIVWAVHFFSLYAIASILPGSTLARMLVLLVSFASLATDALLFVHAKNWRPPDDAGAWCRRIALLSTGVSALAVAWQAIPALLL